LHKLSIYSADAASSFDPSPDLGFIVSSNGRHIILVNKAINYFNMPLYPKISTRGIIHFISYLTPLIQENSTTKQVYKVAKAEIFKVCA